MAATNLGFISFKLEDQLEKPFQYPKTYFYVSHIQLQRSHPSQQQSKISEFVFYIQNQKNSTVNQTSGLSSKCKSKLRNNHTVQGALIHLQKLTMDTTETARNSAFSKFALNLPLRICNFWFKMFLMVEIQQIQIFQLCMVWYLKL